MSSHATPSRPADRDRLPFPYSGTPQSHRSTSTSSSSTTPPTIQSSSSTNALSSSPNVKPTAAPISLSSLLAAHASAQNPHAAALDQALFERNQLSSQNSQLWKLIEKQRSGYNQMLKELERVRAERDSLRGRVSSGGQTKEKVLKASVSNSAMSSSANGPVVASVDVRPLAVRHHSDDMGESCSQPRISWLLI
jgi:RalA-binding protein 1